MNYYAAPMEGLTDRIWRQAHQRWLACRQMRSVSPSIGAA